MNNNGVINNNQNLNNTTKPQEPILTPMEGVKIAPIDSAPINASKQVQHQNPYVQQPIMQNQTSPTPQQPIIQQQTSPAPQPQQPVIQQQIPPQSQINNNTTIQTNTITQNEAKTKKKISIIPLLFVIIIGLAFFIFYQQKSNQAQISQLKYNCTPITSSKKETKLDIESTLVKDLYQKVATNIREDLAQPEFNDNLRLYLAYRQILETEKYDSNCNQFSQTNMEPYTCTESTNFKPKAFKEETIKQEIKKLYGEKTEIPLANIQLGTSCIVGYQYIPTRGEFVQGICNSQTATSYKVDKKLIEAISTQNTIILTEEVKYHENEKMSLPESLKSGKYYYTFRLDMNYNYVLVNKTYESKY